MRFLISAAIVTLTAFSASAQTYRNPYATPNYGTGSNPRSNYVAPHFRSDGNMGGGFYRTNPDTTRSNNFGASGNYNPYTGRTAPQPRPRF